MKILEGLQEILNSRMLDQVKILFLSESIVYNKKHRKAAAVWRHGKREKINADKDVQLVQ